MKKILLKLYKTTLYLIFFLFIILTGITATVQSNWGKTKFKNIILQIAKKNNIVLSIDKLDGILPFEYDLTGVKAQITNNYSVSIDNLKFRIDFLPLLAQKLYFKTIKAKNIHVLLSSNDQTKKGFVTIEKDQWISLPFTIYLKSFDIIDLHLPIKEETLTLNIEGKAKGETLGKRLFCDLTVKRKNFDSSSIRVTALGIKKNHFVKINTNITSDTTKFLTPFVSLKEDFGFDIDVSSKGPWNNYRNLIVNTENEKTPPLTGELKGQIYPQKSDKHLYFLGENLQFFAKFLLNSDLSVKVPFSYAKNDLLYLSGNIDFKPSFTFSEASFTLKTTDLELFKPISIIPLKGVLTSEINIKQDTNYIANVNYQINNFHVNNVKFEESKGNISSTFQKKKFLGKFLFSGNALNLPFTLQTDYSWNPDKLIKFSNISLESPSINGSADLAINEDLMISGQAKTKITNFSQIESFIENIDFNITEASIDATFSEISTPEKKYQKLTSTINLYDFHIDTFMGKEASIALDINDLYHELKGNVSIDFNKLALKNLELDHLNISTSNTQENWPFKILAEGSFKKPVNILMSGFWDFKKGEYSFDLQEISGHFLGFPFSSPLPVQIEYTPSSFIVKDLEIDMEKSHFLANVNLSKTKSEFKIDMEHFPIDFLSLNPMDLSISGFANLKSTFSKNEVSTDGFFNLEIENMQVATIGETDDLIANYFLSGTLKNSSLDLSSELKIKDTQLMEAKISLPTIINFFPCSFTIDSALPLKAEFVCNGQIEELLDFFDIGSHKIEGIAQGNLTISHNLNNPKVEGFFYLNKGLYENYYTGTHLEDVCLKLTSDKNQLTIQEFTATDGLKGTFAATGFMTLKQKEHFPFELKTVFSDLTCMHSDLIDAQATGDVNIQGSMKKAEAKGKILINKALLEIPDRLPATLPHIDITYVNAKPKDDLSTVQIKNAPIPLLLDIDIETNDNIFIRGKGLDSKWQGDFKINGTYSNMVTKGSLNLIHGNFSFSGRDFTLTSGSLTFTGKDRNIPFIDLSGKLSVHGNNIIANLKGYLNAPRLTFTSSPPLPLSSIISYLLFGQDVTEISGIQAAQLAAVASSLSNSPNIMEMTRKSLGVDKLNIVTTPGTTTEDTDQVALQVGKYISKGVIVTFSQGTEQGSSNVIVDIDLSHGFIFELETQQEEEQGKFTLKWNYNY